MLIYWKVSNLLDFINNNIIKYEYFNDFFFKFNIGLIAPIYHHD